MMPLSLQFLAVFDIEIIQAEILQRALSHSTLQETGLGRNRQLCAEAYNDVKGMLEAHSRIARTLVV